MTKRCYPKIIYPLKQALSAEPLSCSIPLSDMKRFLETAETAQQGEVKVSLHCVQESAERCLINIQLEATVQLICQRCLQPSQHKINRSSQLIALQSEAQARQTEIYGHETLVLDDETLDCLNLIEDELLLSIPMFALHQEDELCQNQHYLQDSEPEAIIPAEKVNKNAFDVLKSLRFSGQQEKD